MLGHLPSIPLQCMILKLVVWLSRVIILYFHLGRDRLKCPRSTGSRSGSPRPRYTLALHCSVNSCGFAACGLYNINFRMFFHLGKQPIHHIAGEFQQLGTGERVFKTAQPRLVFSLLCHACNSYSWEFVIQRPCMVGYIAFPSRCRLLRKGLCRVCLETLDVGVKGVRLVAREAFGFLPALRLFCLVLLIMWAEPKTHVDIQSLDMMCLYQDVCFSLHKFLLLFPHLPVERKGFPCGICGCFWGFLLRGSISVCLFYNIVKLEVTATAHLKSRLNQLHAAQNPCVPVATLAFTEQEVAAYIFGCWCLHWTL